MLRYFLYAKLHLARITEADLNYEGSMSIDSELLDIAGIFPNEKIEVYNLNSGQRFSTYAIPTLTGSRKIGANGAAARLVAIGDRVIICAYAALDPDEIKTHQPRILLLDQNNNYTVK